MEVKRPTKKQQELLKFVEQFIAEYGYGPSYREIMRGCNYTSVATVAVHVNNLIMRGHLRKKERSARSLELVDKVVVESQSKQQITKSQEKWLVEKIEAKFQEIEQQKRLIKSDLDSLYVLVGALQVLGLDSAKVAYKARLYNLNQRFDD